MIIKKCRINSVDKYFSNMGEKNIYVSVPAEEKNLRLLGIQDYCGGTCIIPEPKGPVTRFNLHGKDVVRKDLEKELRQIERDYHVIDWHGNHHYGTCFQNRLCYPKDFVLPPMTKIILNNGKLHSEFVRKSETSLLKHTINMFLEIFGYCEIADDNEKLIGDNIKIREVSWEILPPGKYPWDRAKKALAEFFDKSSSKNKETIRKRHKTFAEYGPDFLAIGENSFNDYVVYGYKDRNLYIFESNRPQNATYVFLGDWEDASRLTKFDVIKGKLCYERIIHTDTWMKKIRRLFSTICLKE